MLIFFPAQECCNRGMASISTRERTGSSAQGINYTEFNIRDASALMPLIRVEDDFVGALERHVLADLGGGGDAVTGFLLGSEERGALRITGFQPLAAAGLRSLQDVVNEERGPGAANRLGIYRAARQANHVISRDDLLRFRERFGSGRALFLQVRLFGGPVATGVFYLGENGSLLSDRRSAEWPVNLRELGDAEGSPEPAADKDAGRGKSRRWREFCQWLFGSAAEAFAITVLWSLWPPANRQPSNEARVVSEPAVAAAGRGTPANSAESLAARAGAPAAEARLRPEKAADAPGVAGAQDAFKAARPARPAGLPAKLPGVTGARDPVRTANAFADGIPAVRTPLSSAGLTAAVPLSVPARATEELFAPTPATRPARPRVVPDPEDAGAGTAADPYGVEFRPRVQVTPQVSAAILRQIQGSVTVSIRAEIDEAGNVISAEPLSGAGVQGQVADAVAEAVRRWQFEPARDGGRAVRGQTVLHFRYFNP